MYVIDIHINVCTYMYRHIRTNSHSQIYTRPHARTRMYTHAHDHTNSHVRTPFHIYVRTNTHIHTHTHTCWGPGGRQYGTPAHTYTYTHTRTHINAHTYTHTSTLTNTDVHTCTPIHIPAGDPLDNCWYCITHGIACCNTHRNTHINT